VVDRPESNRPSVSVVVPVYNSQPILPELVARTAEVLGGLTDDYELILVNDGSRDGSWQTIVSLGARYPFVRGIDLMRNFGQHNALLAGIREVRHEIVVTIDDDLQHPPEEIPRLLEALTDEYDVVYGTPSALPHSFGRNVASWLTKLVLQKAMGAETARRIGAFRAFRTPVRKGFEHAVGPFVSLDVLLTWSTTRFTRVIVDHQSRKIGRSNYTLWKLVTHAVNMLAGFSTLPLQLATVIGFGTTVFGFLAFAYVLFRYFTENAAPAGFPFLVAIISMFSGAQLIALGIIGEYLARVHFRIMDRPPYVVRRRVR
jgi:undecaprenyl-phosphate 4-deoxy-4-formamido-L-arabinose transferase